MKQFAVLFAALLLISCGSSGGGTGSAGTTDGSSDQGTTDGEPFCEPLQKFCQGQDVFICQPDGHSVEFMKTCGATEECADGACACKPLCDAKSCGDNGCGGSCGDCAANEACGDDGQCACVPSCVDKECGGDGCGGPCGGCDPGVECSPNGKCGCVADCTDKQCGDDGCGGSCGECEGGIPCSDNGLCDCAPQCEGKTCGDNGCGGLCNGCLDLIYDDGSTETAYGYNTLPDTNPDRLACMVRFELPAKNMKLTRFAAGWMYGLFNLKIPFELGYINGSEMTCKIGNEDSWYNEFCQTVPEMIHKIGDFEPLEPYAYMEVDALGDVTFPEKTVYIAALFDLPAADAWPENGMYVCPIDDSGDGGNSFMMPQYKDGDETLLKASPFKDKEDNPGTTPFRIRVQLSQ